MIKQKYKFVYFLSSMWFLCSIASCSSEITTSSIIKPNFVWTLLKLNWVRKFTSNKSFINFSSTITHKFCALMLFEIFVGLSEMVPLLYFSFSLRFMYWGMLFWFTGWNSCPLQSTGVGGRIVLISRPFSRVQLYCLCSHSALLSWVSREGLINLWSHLVYSFKESLRW